MDSHFDLSAFTMQITRDEFDEMVQDALDHLYDTPHLQAHPLTELLTNCDADVAHRCQQLRRLLLESIRRLRPKPGVPTQSPDWRAYSILDLRYVEGQDARRIMEHISISKSQYYREQTSVVKLIASMLWDHWLADPAANRELHPSETNGAERDSRHSLAELEVERLSAKADWGPLDVGEVLHDLRAYVEPLAAAKSATISFDATESFVVSNSDRVLLRQAILNVITYGLDLASQDKIDVRLYCNHREKGIRITMAGHVATTSARTGVGLNVCRQILARMGGDLTIRNPEDGLWQALLRWEVTEPQVLLVIDDNAGFVDLFRRYLNNSRWQVVGADNSEEARQLLNELHPAAIILDVMMPQEDGWETLRSLRSVGSLLDTPIIICSVLHEPELARSLGASDYLLKPITQQDLLRVLEKDFQGVANQDPKH